MMNHNPSFITTYLAGVGISLYNFFSVSMSKPFIPVVSSMPFFKKFMVFVVMSSRRFFKFLKTFFTIPFAGKRWFTTCGTFALSNHLLSIFCSSSNHTHTITISTHNVKENIKWQLSASQTRFPLVLQSSPRNTTIILTPSDRWHVAERPHENPEYAGNPERAISRDSRFAEALRDYQGVSFGIVV